MHQIGGGAFESNDAAEGGCQRAQQAVNQQRIGEQQRGCGNQSQEELKSGTHVALKFDGNRMDAVMQTAKMQRIAAIAGLVMWAIGTLPGDAQTQPPRSADPTFGTDWAKPQRPNPGGWIYNDPRLRQQRPLDPRRPFRSCPAGRMYDPVNQTCR